MAQGRSTMPSRRAWILAAALQLVAGAAVAEPVTVGDLVLERPWVRATPPAAAVAGGYVTITNAGTTADRLVGGEAAFAARVEIHEMAMTDGVMRMRELADGLTVAPGATVTLEPGGYHVMFMGLTEPLVEGEAVDVTLTFAEAGDVTIAFDVAAIGARTPPAD